MEAFLQTFLSSSLQTSIFSLIYPFLSSWERNITFPLQGQPCHLCCQLHFFDFLFFVSMILSPFQALRWFPFVTLLCMFQSPLHSPFWKPSASSSSYWFSSFIFQLAKSVYTHFSLIHPQATLFSTNYLTRFFLINISDLMAAPVVFHSSAS